MVNVTFGTFDYWGDHANGKLIDIVDIIGEDIKIKKIPSQEKGRYGVVQLLLSDKPVGCKLDKIKEFYEVNFFKNDDNHSEYKYLMLVEPLRFTYEEEVCMYDRVSKEITGNKWDYDGYFYVTDAYNDYRRVAIVPYAVHGGEFDGGHNYRKEDAELIVKGIVKLLNEGSVWE